MAKKKTKALGAKPSSVKNDIKPLSIEEAYDRVRAMLAEGKRTGYLLYEEVNEVFARLPDLRSEILIQAVVVKFGGRTDEGQLVQAVAIPWFEIIEQLKRDPDFLFKVSWRKLEEIIAGAYTRAGCPEVILTPRSGDKGRDIIATWPGFGAVRIVDQVKAYARGHLVTADQVNSMLGVLSREPGVSKGHITTTSDFAPGIHRDDRLKAFMPYRLQLINGSELRKWLTRPTLGARRTI